MRYIKNRRYRWAIVASILLHVLLILGIHSSGALDDNRNSAPVELQVTVLSQRQPTPETETSKDEIAQIPISEVISEISATQPNSRKHLPAAKNILTAEKKKKAAIRGDSTAAPSSNLAIATQTAPNEDTDSAETTPPPELKTHMAFTDFEQMMGAEAKEARRQYRNKSDLTRRQRGAIVPRTKELATALRNRRSVLTGENMLPSGAKARLISQYLKSIHQELAPRFSAFLDTLDQPYERMHKKIQNSPLKYNPFYMPPPDSERQQAMRGPLGDLSINAVAEFEILPSGALAEIRLIRSSNHIVFDTAAIDTVMKSAPFIPPPQTLLSRNNRSYIQWTFQRDWKKNTWGQGHLYLLAPSLNTDEDTDLQKQGP